MAKNRKKNVQAFAFPAPFAGFVVALAIFAFGYVWLGCRCDTLGKEIKALETEKTELTKKMLNEEYKWTLMKAPQSVERELAKYGIVMGWPKPNQIVRVSDQDEYVKSQKQVAARTGKTGGFGRTVMNE